MVNPKVTHPRDFRCWDKDDSFFDAVARELGWLKDGLPLARGLRSSDYLHRVRTPSCDRTLTGFSVADHLRLSTWYQPFFSDSSGDRHESEKTPGHFLEGSDRRVPIGLRELTGRVKTFFLVRGWKDFLAGGAFLATAKLRETAAMITLPEDVDEMDAGSLSELRSKTVVICVNRKDFGASERAARIGLKLHEGGVATHVFDMASVVGSEPKTLNDLWIENINAPSESNVLSDALRQLATKELTPIAELLQEHGHDLEGKGDATPKPEFPFDAFKGPSADLARSVSAARPVPPELPFIVELAIIGALTGKKVEVTNKMSGHDTPGNVFCIVSARTGAGKSIAAKELMAPLYALEQEVVQRWESKAAAWRTELKRINARGLRALKIAEGSRGDSESTDGSEADERRREELERFLSAGRPRWIDASPTPEGLRESMATFGECGFVFTTEGEAILQIMNGKRMKTASRFGEFCGLFSGDYTGGSRISRESAVLSDPRLSAFIAVQPDLAKELRFGDEARARGLSGRFVWFRCSPSGLIDPDKPSPRIDRETVDEHARVCAQLFERYVDPDSTTPLVKIPLCDEAARYVHRRAAEDQRRHHNEELFSEIRVRAAELITRMALALHLMEHGVAGERVEIPLTTVRNAERLYEWALSAWLPDEENSEEGKMEGYWKDILSLFEETQAPFTAREIYRALGLSSEEGKRLVQRFCEMGLLQKASGGPSRTVHYTPALGITPSAL